MTEKQELTMRKNPAGKSVWRTQEMILTAMFTTLIAVGAFIKIPVPVVPFTLQFLFTMLAGLLLGGKRGAASVGLYMLLGLAGLPVFAGGGGLWYVANPSFGYIIGFCLAAFVTGKMAERLPEWTTKNLLAANLAGLIIVYAVGMAYYYFVSNYMIHTPIGLWPLFLYCFILAVPGDICLCIAAAVIGKRMKPVIKRMR